MQDLLKTLSCRCVPEKCTARIYQNKFFTCVVGGTLQHNIENDASQQLSGIGPVSLNEAMGTQSRQSLLSPPLSCHDNLTLPRTA